MSMRIEVCQIHGQDSRRFSERKTSQSIYVVRSGEKQIRKRKSMKGLSKNQSSMMLEDFEALTLSTRKMASTRKPFRETQGKSWKFRWRQLRLARWERESASRSCCCYPRKRFKTLSCAHDSRCLASPSTPTPCYSLAAWLRNLFSQVTSSSLSSNSAASTPRSSTKNSFDADFDNLATTVAASEMPRHKRRVTVDFTTVFSGARSKCHPIQCFWFSRTFKRGKTHAGR